MCGIIGILSGPPIGDRSALARARDTMHHRGPDAAGEWWSEDGSAGLGHRRLAIIDLSPSGRQPMEDEGSGNRIVFNGEIYNFLELRRELEESGHRFRSRTDTEVILKAYAAWGLACVERLRGIFAFGLWDAARKTLLLARDPLGVKPLYIWQDGRRLVFASEVRAVLATGLVPRKLDRDGLLSYLAYGSVQEPFTLVRGIRSLPAGHWMEWRCGPSRTERYWRIPPPETIRPGPPESRYAEVAQCLTDAVQSQLIADVPLGAFLSGGIDSTAITALMCRAADGPVRTFSLVFREALYDERAWSRLAARYIGTSHTEVEITGEMVQAHLDRALDAFDQPSVDGLNTFFVSKAAREAGLTVALSGVGGDELFGGYGGYRKALLAEQIHPAVRRLPDFARRGLSSLLDRWGRSEISRKASDLLLTSRHPFFVTRRLFSSRQTSRLLDREIILSGSWEEEALGLIESEAGAHDPINRVSSFELQTYMRSTLLRDTDQMSMAHALEVRVPLIDQKLVELCFSFPGGGKLDARQPKPLLTRPLGDLLPRECVNRPKRGFELPFQMWLRKSLEAEMQELFCHTSAADVRPLSGPGLGRLWDEFRSGRVSWSRVWAMFVLHRWLVRHEVKE